MIFTHRVHNGTRGGSPKPRLGTAKAHVPPEYLNTDRPTTSHLIGHFAVERIERMATTFLTMADDGPTASGPFNPTDGGEGCPSPSEGSSPRTSRRRRATFVEEPNTSLSWVPAPVDPPQPPVSHLAALAPPPIEPLNFSFGELAMVPHGVGDDGHQPAKHSTIDSNVGRTAPPSAFAVSPDQLHHRRSSGPSQPSPTSGRRRKMTLIIVNDSEESGADCGTSSVPPPEEGAWSNGVLARPSRLAGGADDTDLLEGSDLGGSQTPVWGRAVGLASASAARDEGMLSLPSAGGSDPSRRRSSGGSGGMITPTAGTGAYHKKRKSVVELLKGSWGEAVAGSQPSAPRGPGSSAPSAAAGGGNSNIALKRANQRRQSAIFQKFEVGGGGGGGNLVASSSSATFKPGSRRPSVTSPLPIQAMTTSMILEGAATSTTRAPAELVDTLAVASGEFVAPPATGGLLPLNESVGSPLAHATTMVPRRGEDDNDDRMLAEQRRDSGSDFVAATSNFVAFASDDDADASGRRSPGRQPLLLRTSNEDDEDDVQSLLEEALSQSTSPRNIFDIQMIKREEFERIEFMFHQFDKNKSGTIDTDELRDVMIALGHRLTDESIPELMYEITGDRHSKEIDFESFVKLILFWKDAARFRLFEKQLDNFSDDRFERKVGTTLFLSDGAFRTAWDLAMLVTNTLLLGLVAIVYLLPWSDLMIRLRTSGLIVTLEVIVAIFCACDMWVWMNTSMRTVKLVTLKRSDVILEYMHLWFWIDLVAVVPFWLIAVGAQGSEVDKQTTARIVAYSLTWVRIFKGALRIWFSLFRESGVTLVGPLYVIVRYRIVPGVNVMCGFLLFVHVASLVLIALHDGEFRRGRLATDPNAILPPASSLSYITAVYQIMGVVSSVGLDIVPGATSSDSKKWYLSFVMIVATLISGLVVGNIVSGMSVSDIDGVRQQKLAETSAVCSFFGIPQSLSEEILQFQDHILLHNVRMSYSLLMNSLPEEMRLQLAVYARVRQIRHHPLFKTAHEGVKIAIGQALEEIVYCPEEYVTIAGDMEEEMFFIAHGFLDVVSKRGQYYRTLKPGDSFGENSLFAACKRSVSVKTLTYCDVFALSSLSFAVVTERFPTFKLAVEAELRVAADRLRRRRWAVIDEQRSIPPALLVDELCFLDANYGDEGGGTTRGNVPNAVSLATVGSDVFPAGSGVPPSVSASAAPSSVPSLASRPETDGLGTQPRSRHTSLAAVGNSVSTASDVSEPTASLPSGSAATARLSVGDGALPDSRGISPSPAAARPVPAMVAAALMQTDSSSLMQESTMTTGGLPSARSTRKVLRTPHSTTSQKGRHLMLVPIIDDDGSNAPPEGVLDASTAPLRKADGTVAVPGGLDEDGDDFVDAGAMLHGSHRHPTAPRRVIATALGGPFQPLGAGGHAFDFTSPTTTGSGVVPNAVLITRKSGRIGRTAQLDGGQRTSSQLQLKGSGGTFRSATSGASGESARNSLVALAETVNSDVVSGGRSSTAFGGDERRSLGALSAASSDSLGEGASEAQEVAKGSADVSPPPPPRLPSPTQSLNIENSSLSAKASSGASSANASSKALPQEPAPLVVSGIPAELSMLTTSSSLTNTLSVSEPGSTRHVAASLPDPPPPKRQQTFSSMLAASVLSTDENALAAQLSAPQTQRDSHATSEWVSGQSAATHVADDEQVHQRRCVDDDFDQRGDHGSAETTTLSVRDFNDLVTEVMRLQDLVHALSRRLEKPTPPTS